MLSRLVIAFLPRSKHLLISRLQSPSSVILKPKKMKSATIPFLLHLFALQWWDRMPCLSFLNVEFKPAFSLSSFTFIKKLFNSSSLSAIRVVSSAYLRLLIFLPAVLTPSHRLCFFQPSISQIIFPPVRIRKYLILLILVDNLSYNKFLLKFDGCLTSIFNFRIYSFLKEINGYGTTD